MPQSLPKIPPEASNLNSKAFNLEELPLQIFPFMDLLATKEDWSIIVSVIHFNATFNFHFKIKTP